MDEDGRLDNIIFLLRIEQLQKQHRNQVESYTLNRH